MMRAVITHGWDGTPQEGWFPWLKSELEKRGFQVIVPQLPNPENPKIENWVPALTKSVGIPDENTYFVGHSMGCQAIARYLAGLDESIMVGGVVYVAGFFDSLMLGSGEKESVWAEWRDTPLDLSRVRARAPKSIALFSDNDPYVPLANQGTFKDKLGSEIVVKHDVGHFNESAGYFELPIVLESVLQLAGMQSGI